MRPLYFFTALFWFYLATAVWFDDWEPARWIVGGAFALLAIRNLLNAVWSEP